MKRLSSRRIPVFGLLLMLTFLLGAVARVLGAWWQRNTHNPDFGVVALMARHMAEGIDVPVFFYGQPYMGNVEPLASALFCLVMGFSGFAVCLGTALWGVLLLPLLYRWARDMGGRVAGWGAMAFAAIGSIPYFHYQCSPRGGYSATLLLGSLVLWLAGDIVYAERRGSRPGAMRYLVLGIFAGLGWWADQLVAPALAAAALLFPVILGMRCFSLKLLTGIAGFVVGSLPFWIWNLRNDWATFRFAESVSLDNLGENAWLLLSIRLPDVLGLHEMTMMCHWAVALIFGGAALFVALVEIRRWWRWGLTRGTVHGVGIMLFCLLFVMAFSVSKYAGLNTPRYALPLVPIAAVVVGLALRHAGRRCRLPVLLLLLGLIAAHGWNAYAAFAPLAAEQEKWSRCKLEFIGQLGSLGLRDFYAGYEHNIFNSLLDDEFCFSDVAGERYGPHAERLEQSVSPAVYENYGLVNQFVQATGGSADTLTVGETTATYNLRPPVEGLVELPGNCVSEWKDSRKRKVGHVLSDRQLDTIWSSIGMEDGTGWLELRLKEPVQLARLRLLALNANYPEQWRVLGALGNREWQALTPELTDSGYFWSGPRFYYGGAAFRLDVKLADLCVDRLRIHVSRSLRHGPIEIGELQLFVKGDVPPSESESLETLVVRLQELGPTHLFCDRWIANELGRVGPIGLTVPVERDIHRNLNAVPVTVFERLTAHSMMLVRQENAQACRDVLAECGIAMTEEVLGPWVLFRFGEDQWRESAGLDYGLCWIGAELQIGSSRRLAYGLLDAARLNEAESPVEAARMLERALAHYPNCRPAVVALARIYSGLGLTEKARSYQDLAEHMWTPSIAFNIDFDGLVLKGIDIEPTQSHAGSSVMIRYFWTCRPDAQLKNYVCFVHFRDGARTCFQDDHRVLHWVDYNYQTDPEVFVEERDVSLPGNVDPGQYTMTVGLYDNSRHGWRLMPRTDLPVHRRAVQLPAGVEVLADPVATESGL